MPKRDRENSDCSLQPSKRFKVDQDRLSILSDELLLRVLSNLPVQTLGTCHRVSRRLKIIAGDAELWRAAYYERFVLPRSRRARRHRGTDRLSSNSAASRLSKWLDEGDLVRKGTQTNWKRQYKLRDNWSRGTARKSDIPVADQPRVPPILGRLHAGIVYTVDSADGIRAWSYKHEKRLLAAKPLFRQDSGNTSKPTAFALDTTSKLDGIQAMVIGFENGLYSVYCYETNRRLINHTFTHPASSRKMIIAAAFASPYIITMNEARALSIFNLPDPFQGKGSLSDSGNPRLLASLTSQTVWSPLSLSIRTTPTAVTASIAYVLPVLGGSWSTGIQELVISPDGISLDSRLASATGEDFQPISSYPRQVRNPDGAFTRAPPGYGQKFSRPTSISYSHPYMLVAHSDNTLTLYLVNSTAQNLSIGPGKRLWGHTSSVFGAHVGMRGKAVSVATRGDEIRVWELEGRAQPRSLYASYDEEAASVSVKPEQREVDSLKLNRLSQAIGCRGNGLGLALEFGRDDLAWTRAWVGFDEESVVILREQEHGHQDLTVYDFT